MSLVSDKIVHDNIFKCFFGEASNWLYFLQQMHCGIVNTVSKNK